MDETEEKKFESIEGADDVPLAVIDIGEEENLRDLAVTDSPEVRVGDHYMSDGGKWCVVDVRLDGIMLISLEKKEIQRVGFRIFIEQIETGVYKKMAHYQANMYDISHDEMMEINKRTEVLEMFLENLYPRWDLLFTRNINKHAYDDTIVALGLKRRRVMELLLVYLRSGRNKFALADKRKNNSRPKIEYSADFEEPRNDIDLLLRYGLQEFHRYKDAKRAYEAILRRYFREPEEQPDGSVKLVTLPQEQIPISYKMVYNYISSHLGGLTIRQYMLDAKNRQNNFRQLPGDSKYGVYRLGQIMEADETELPCYCVDHDIKAVIGKPVLYALTELKSEMVTGLYVSLENNSNLGFRQAFLSMLEPHHNQTDKYGLSYTEDEFPSLIVPEEIRCDHGAEYMSKNYGKALAEIGIRNSPVPVACGSMKGVVEKFHHLVQQHLKAHLREAGLIETTYRGGDVAKGSACLTIEEIRELVAKAVLLVNCRPLTKTPRLEYIKADIPMTPVGIYQYEKEHSGDPRNVTNANRANYLYKMLAKEEDRRKFTWDRRRGIVYTFLKRKLYFYSSEMWFIDLLKDEKHLENIEVRYNETDVSCVYICYKKQIHRVPLAEKRQDQLTFSTLTWNMYDDWIRCLHGSETQKKAAKDALDKRLQFQDEVDHMVGMAKVLNQLPQTKYGKADPKNKERKKEQMQMDTNEINNRMYQGIDPATPHPDDVPKIEEKPLSIMEQLMTHKEKDPSYSQEILSREEEIKFVCGLLDDEGEDD